MGIRTEIGWCDSTVNPTTGCDGCELHVPGKGGPCYAGILHVGRLATALPELYAPTFTEVRLAPGRMARAAAWSDLAGKRRPDRPWLDGMPRIIFIGDMGDVLSDDVPSAYLREEVVGNVMGRGGRRHIWMLLTKRPTRLAELEQSCGGFPDNLWCGTSITNRASLKRIDALRAVQAKVRFLSIEPLLEDPGAIDLTGLSLCIVGGESGPNARVCDLAWVRSIVEQCKAAGVSCFVKQDSGPRPGMQGRIPDDIWGVKEVAHA